MNQRASISTGTMSYGWIDQYNLPDRCRQAWKREHALRAEGLPI